MVDSGGGWKSLVLLLALVGSAPAACLATDSSNQAAAQVAVTNSLPPPSMLRDYVVDGKLQLTLEDAIRLTVANNTDVRLAHTPVDQARYNLLSAYSRFDPLLTSNESDQRSLTPATNNLQGAQTLNTLTQQVSAGYTETFETGTNVNGSFIGSKSDTNSSFFFVNPYLTANLNFQATQPLLKNRGLFPNMAPIRIAQRNLNESQANFEAQVNNLIQTAIDQYWNVVLARESLGVAQQSLRQAEATYQHDKRSLDLGALPPLDIYRSESEVAQRRVAEIQAEYALKQQEDLLRQVTGADLDPYVRALDLDLKQDPSPEEPLFSIDETTAMEEARVHRPEFTALDEQLAGDDLSVRLARNQLLPDVELGGFYTSQGLGGNELSTTTLVPVIIPGGLGTALSELFRFNFPTYGATLTFNFPLHNRAARATLGQASVAKRNDLYAMRREGETVRLDVVNAVHSLEQTKLSIAAAKIARDLAQKNMESEQRKYELGTGTIFLVLEGQTELAQTEVSLVQAQVGYQMALAAVDHATGTLLDRHRIEVEAAAARP